MFGVETTIEDKTRRVVESANKASFKNVSHAAAAIRVDAIASIQPGDGPSPAGTPPHTHTQKVIKAGRTKKGLLPAAITFAADKQVQDAVIGPRHSIVDLAGEAHEKGKTFQGDQYPERSFMGPALERKQSRFGASFQGSIGE